MELQGEHIQPEINCSEPTSFISIKSYLWTAADISKYSTELSGILI